MIPIRDSTPSRSAPVVTRVLILINALVFFYELSLSGKSLQNLFYVFGIVPARFTDPAWASEAGFSAGGWWVFLTHQFLHGGWLHILSNMWMLWIFGNNVEDAMGHLRYGVFYLLSGVLAGLAQLLAQPHSQVPSLGASGAIAGVLGAYFLLYPKARLTVVQPVFFRPIFFELPAVLYLGLWFGSQLFNGTLALASPEQGGGIAFWAHVGGFCTGMLLCRLFVRRQQGPHSDDYKMERAWRG
ncbi:MAG: rhomboid family intramembrane serine protease [Verrucomicrobiota bacterium]|jgi:membrane associated rhomboid family serine protease